MAQQIQTVLFACVHNAGRSQMAAAFFNLLADPAKARAVSAGMRPAQHIHPEVIGAMNEVGLDLTSIKPRRLTEELAAGASLLVTMGCGESCPVIPGLRREDWALADPRGQDIARVRQIRDQIRWEVARLIATEGWKLSGFDTATGPSAD